MIKVQNLAKVFGTKRAVDDVSFSVNRGEVLGFLGPNGAGKSTTMRMITGFLPPSGGSVTVGGFDIVEHPIEAKRLIGYLPENAPAYTDMTVYGFLNFTAEIRGLRGDARKQAVNRAVEMCFLEAVLHQSVETLSKGLSPPHLFRAVDHPRPRRAGAGRADGRAGSEPETRGAAVDPADGREEGDHLLDAHPGGSGCGLLAGDHHRPRQDRGQRHAAGTAAEIGMGRGGDAAGQRRRLQRGDREAESGAAGQAGDRGG